MSSENVDSIEDNCDSSFEDQNKENIHSLNPKKIRSTRRTDAQFDLLKSNAPEKSQSHSEKIDAWRALSVKLNEIGPPIHNWSDWRKIWIDFKSRDKRRRNGNSVDGKIKRRSF